ncbi:MAG: hypothetical protein AB7S44_00525 [Spirochaetales bacterium]
MYKIVVTIIVFSLATVVALPLINVLNANNFFIDLKDTLSTFMLNLDFNIILLSISSIVNLFVSVIAANLGAVIYSLIGVFLIIIVLGGFLNGLSELAVTDTLNGYMSSNANFSFLNSYIKNFGKSLKLQLAKLAINLPINLIITYLIYLTLPLLYSSDYFVLLLAPLIVITLSTVLIALNITVFSGVIPAITVHNCGVFEGYRRGFKAVSRRFFKTLSNSIVIVFTILIVNAFVTIITAGAGLIITLPSSTFLLAIFGMVMYYGSMGMRYYVDPETILSPKKLEEQDKMRYTKFVI